MSVLLLLKCMLFATCYSNATSELQHSSLITHPHPHPHPHPGQCDRTKRTYIQRWMFVLYRLQSTARARHEASIIPHQKQPERRRHRQQQEKEQEQIALRNRIGLRK
jgi:hypothetical protein